MNHASSTPLAVALSATVALGSVLGCSSSSEGGASRESRSAIEGVACPVGGGQCLVAVQSFFSSRGINVGVAGSAATDAQGRYCETYGACLMWIDDVPSRYGWVRTSRPSPYDIAVFPPHPGNPYGHITIVHHVDGSGVWMIDSNDGNDDVANNVPHLHAAAPYGFYHWPGSGALAACGATPTTTSGGDGNGGCAGLNDGLYCGGDHVSGDASTLYRCARGSSAVEETCAAGCRGNPDGTDDACN